MERKKERKKERKEEKKGGGKKGTSKLGVKKRIDALYRALYATLTGGLMMVALTYLLAGMGADATVVVQTAIVVTGTEGVYRWTERGGTER